jgi:hypothetical protein
MRSSKGAARRSPCCCHKAGSSATSRRVKTESLGSTKSCRSPQAGTAIRSRLGHASCYRGRAREGHEPIVAALFAPSFRSEAHRQSLAVPASPTPARTRRSSTRHRHGTMNEAWRLPPHPSPSCCPKRQCGPALALGPEGPPYRCRDRRAIPRAAIGSSGSRALGDR